MNILKEQYLLSHHADFHPVTINHKPNSHIDILPAAAKKNDWKTENRERIHVLSLIDWETRLGLIWLTLPTFVRGCQYV